MKKISRLHFITDSAHKAAAAAGGGVDWVQLRMKNASDDEIRNEAAVLKSRCGQSVRLIVNDKVQLAAEIGADGVHIGKEDMNPMEARALLGDGAIIGCTANTIDDILRLAAMPVDYIGLGPFRYTRTKHNLSPVLGIEGYGKIFEALGTAAVQCPPIVAIGGIEWTDISELMATGIHGIAVSGAIARGGDIARDARAFASRISYEVLGKYTSKDSWLDAIGEQFGEIDPAFGDILSH